MSHAHCRHQTASWASEIPEALGGPCREHFHMLFTNTCELARLRVSLCSLSLHAEFMLQRMRIEVRLGAVATKLLHFTDFHRLLPLRMPMDLVRRGSEGTEPKPRRSLIVVMPRPRLFAVGRFPQPARRTESNGHCRKQGAQLSCTDHRVSHGRERVNVRVMESLR